MQKEVKGSRRDPPRAYDRRSGEYRPISRAADSQDVDFAAAAQHRAEQRRKHRRHVLVVFYLFLFLLVLSAAAVLSLTVLFKISNVYVTGTSRYSQQQIIDASGIKTGNNLFLVKTGQASQKIKQELPYLGTVNVNRKFPAEIEISVKEESIWGAAKLEGKYVIIGENGTALEFVNGIPKDCTELKGLTIKKAQVGSSVEFSNADTDGLVKNVMSSLKKNGFSSITSVDFTQSAKILVLYDGRITINLGMPTDLDYKLNFAKNILKNNIKNTERGTLNMTVVSSTNKAYFDPQYGAVSSSSASSAKK